MKHLLFDTETTGLVDNRGQDLSKQPQVIEFYGTIIGLHKNPDGNVLVEELGELEFLANPGKPLPDIIKKITGLSDAMLKGAKPFSDHYDELQAFFGLADISVAHNFSFDKQLIDFEAQRLKKEFIWTPKTLCTVEATEHIKGHRFSLSKLYEHLFPGETFPGAHRAKADVMALKRCYVELFKAGIV